MIKEKNINIIPSFKFLRIYKTNFISCIEFESHGVKLIRFLFFLSAAAGVPKRTPIQVLSRPNAA